MGCQPSKSSQFKCLASIHIDSKSGFLLTFLYFFLFIFLSTSLIPPFTFAAAFQSEVFRSLYFAKAFKMEVGEELAVASGFTGLLNGTS